MLYTFPIGSISLENPNTYLKTKSEMARKPTRKAAATYNSRLVISICHLSLVK